MAKSGFGKILGEIVLLFIVSVPLIIDHYTDKTFCILVVLAVISLYLSMIKLNRVFSLSVVCLLSAAAVYINRDYLSFVFSVIISVWIINNLMDNFNKPLFISVILINLVSLSISMYHSIKHYYIIFHISDYFKGKSIVLLIAFVVMLAGLIRMVICSKNKINNQSVKLMLSVYVFSFLFFSLTCLVLPSDYQYYTAFRIIWWIVYMPYLFYNCHKVIKDSEKQ